MPGRGRPQGSQRTFNTWVIDWGALERLPFRALYSAPTRPQQFSMLKFGRADVTLRKLRGSVERS